MKQAQIDSIIAEVKNSGLDKQFPGTSEKLQQELKAGSTAYTESVILAWANVHGKKQLATEIKKHI